MRAELVLLLFVLLHIVPPAAAEPISALESIVNESVRPQALLQAKRRAPVAQLPVYDLDIDVASSMDAFTLREVVSFVYQGQEPSDHALLFLYANIGRALGPGGAPALRFVEGACTSAPGCTVTAESPGVLRASFEQPLRAGDVASVSLTIEGRLVRLSSERTSLSGQTLDSLSSLLRGAETSDYGLLAAADGVLSAGGFMAVLAPRDAQGKWAGPPLKVLGDLTSDELAHVKAKLRVPPGVRVATVGRVSSEREGPAGFREYQVDAGLVRDFAFVATQEPEVFERQVGDVLVRVHVSKSAREHGNRILETAAGALSLFDAAFAPYPYRELEVVEAPLLGGVGGVEFSGMVTIASALLEPEGRKDGISQLLTALSGMLADRAGALVPDRGEMLDMVVAHEVAHQWWHVLVGSDSREQPFVDEGLAQWSALFYLERRRGPSAARRARQQLVLSYQTMRLLGEPDAPVRQPVDSFATQKAYAGLVYGKGPLGYERLRRVLGDKRFLRVLAAYTTRYAFRSAPQDGFEKVAATVSTPQTVRGVTRRWWDELHGDEDLGTMAGSGGQLDLDTLFGRGFRQGQSDSSGAGGEPLQQMKSLLEQLLRNGR